MDGLIDGEALGLEGPRLEVQLPWAYQCAIEVEDYAKLEWPRPRGLARIQSGADRPQRQMLGCRWP